MIKNPVQIIIFIGMLMLGNLPCLSAEVRYFDHTNLGQSVGDIHLHLNNNSTNFVAPIEIELNTDDGVIRSIIVKFPKSISLEEVRKSVNKNWAIYENKKLATNEQGGGWRSNELCFAAILSKDEDGYVMLSISKISVK